MTTMTDTACVNAYVSELKSGFATKWTGKSPLERAKFFHDALSNVHRSVNMPVTGLDVKDLPPGVLGQFDFQPWSIDISNDLFDDNRGVVNAKSDHFVDLAETFYHEGRHAEQWWHMARFEAIQPMKGPTGANVKMTAAELAKRLFIKEATCKTALDNVMGGNDPMLSLTKRWFTSVYGESGREVTLTALSLTRNNNNKVNLQDFHNRTHQAYSGGLPEEEDAWGIQVPVRMAMLS
ncbi:hypothetical protein [Variovorax sp. YR216]|uniref:hypothetical protein n=1 Tax=Variovorax sp. YR216 TaxID=1882828 RepID=UPI0008962B36|nr:hypothetical protein [Variovorax sp. YR216]SEB16243.1 hypothetical protein SAMN05444680_110163 [Variovorax sp. YR216]